MPRKSFKYRIYPTKAQAATLESHLKICCELYNAALEERRDAWKVARKNIGHFDQTKQLPPLKAERPELWAIPSRTLYEPLRRVDRAFRDFFRRVKAGQKPGYPRFRSYRRYDSLMYDACLKLQGRMLTLPKFGAIKVKLHRPIEGKLKTATIKREAGRWFAILGVEYEPVPLPVSAEAIGIDVGLTHFATLSDGTQIANPRPERTAARRMRRAQRRVGRRIRGSNRRRKAVALLTRARAHVRQQRTDFHHKLSRAIVNSYGVIAVEDLNVHGLAGGMLARSVHDAGWALFIDRLTYKAANAGRELIKVDPRGTSQTCTCGASVRKRLSDREHVCTSCGLVADRDHVSAQVILQRSARMEPSGVNVAERAACVA